MYLEHKRLKSIFEYLEASDKLKKQPLNIPKIDNFLPKLSNDMEKVKSKFVQQKQNIHPKNHSNFQELYKAFFSQLNPINQTFNEVIKNSEKTFDLSYLVKPKQDNNLILFKMFCKESAHKPFKSSKSALFLLNHNNSKNIEILPKIQPEIKPERGENISCKPSQIKNLIGSDFKGRNSKMVDLFKDRVEKESKSRIQYLDKNEKTLDFQSINIIIKKPVTIKAPNFQNNKLFIALGKPTLKKKNKYN